MINSPPLSSIETTDDEAVAAIVRSGPSGALVVAGIATGVVIALWFAFYLFVFLARAAA